MIVIISLLLILSFIILVIGLVSPKIIRMKSRKRVLAYGIPAIFILFILGLVTAPELSPEQKAEIEQRKAEKEQAAIAKQEEKEKQKIADKKKAVAENKEKEEKNSEKEKESIPSNDKKKEKKKEKQDDNPKKQDNKKKDTDVAADKLDKKETPKENLSNAKGADSISTLLKKDYDQIENVLLENEIAIVVYSNGSFWSETSAFKDFAIDSTSIMKELKGNKNINGIGFVQMMDMTDKKGNESVERTMITYFDKDNYDDINFKNFTGQVYTEPSRFYEVSNGYWMHPSVYQNIKDKALNGLPFVPGDTSKGFETVSNVTN
ncbi:hypothetical protein WMZ97_12975 [Lentibacillus sp. N15]|uniref:hypothetical protein n=1 Tax=Lentibacillus songyuanensis TaxID=3136161 RepID=UPI0031BBC442